MISLKKKLNRSQKILILLFDIFIQYLNHWSSINLFVYYNMSKTQNTATSSINDTKEKIINLIFIFYYNIIIV